MVHSGSESYSVQVLICDAHEWSNVILTVPICDSAKPLPRERAWG